MFARDSMLNLAELASSRIEDETEDHDDDDDDDDDNKDDYAAHQLTKDEGESSFSKLAGSTDDEEQQIERKNKTGNDETEGGAVVQVINPNNSDDTKGPESTSESSSSNLDDRPSQSINNGSKPPKPQGQPQQYAGFQADYHDFENYTSYSFDGDNLMSKGSTPYGINNNQNEEPWWQCIFPWFSKAHYIDHQETTQIKEDPSPKLDTTSDDEISMISAGSDNALGERLSQRDHQAVLARLRLAQPDPTTDATATATAADNQNNQNDNVIDGTTDFKKKSILKRSINRVRDNRNLLTASNSSFGSNSSSPSRNRRRSLFPAYEPKTETKKNLNITFSPMARVVTIKSSKDMDAQEKASIWWQKPNYDEFRKTGRMISKVMLQGGSEIWLATNQSWQLPNQGKAATLRRAMANIDNEDTGDKWWHKFGHSRRGLEHIASIDEGRQRQTNVKTAIRAILTEQRRQKAFHREDPEKLRMASIQNTSWAKDLSLASGASDADAVSKNFDDENRKSREFYLLKFSRAGQNADVASKSANKQNMPAFMRPILSMQLKNRLDANTTSRLQFQKKQQKAAANHSRVSSDLPAIKASRPTIRVPIHADTFGETSSESLASKAAGFANGEEAVNMSAALAGMGPIPKTPDARPRPVLA